MINEDQEEALVNAIASNTVIDVSFLTAKEQADLQLASQLRREGKITTPGDPFEQSDRTEIEALQARDVFRFVTFDITHQYPDNTIMEVVKPLYGIAEAGTHWWATYFRHHREKLGMTTSTYDPYLLISAGNDRTDDTDHTGDTICFGIVGMQTDDTLGLSDDAFFQREELELTKAGFNAKPKTRLSPTVPLIFNGCILTANSGGMTLCQKGQSKKITTIDKNTPTAQRNYVEQRARGAYVATVCQPEASFDLSVAAQHQQPDPEDIARLNKRLQWQRDNQDRGLRYINLALTTAKLFVFVDGSFANNKDLSSQIGYVIVLGNEEDNPTDNANAFLLTGNIITYSSTKSKRVTRSALASELYSMVQGVDIAYAIGTTLNMITSRLGLPKIPTVVCTDSFSLYECLVKLGTTKEKRLMIDIMALRQSYERREIYEIRWINGNDNLADAMTKGTPNKALETFVDRNQAVIRVEGWVKRPVNV
ncbi:hypothetical protein UVI_02042530 [Ustilaginoidea virens]|uniref:Polyprotein n=1 Tax=Ustilaginoidea virens TaxID=1159556 RepID=A0A1B5L8R0_USTVR|nr:hypothetical protein UVI_02042530 [Ustilaginoidea virens]